MIDNPTFQKIQKFIYNEVGINLTDAKKALVSSRMGKRMRDLNIEHYRDYFHYVENDKSGEELIKFFNNISTNVTYFFRENDHFTKLSEVFKNSLKQGAQKYRIWSSACSSGEEPYSIAITLKDILANKRFDVKILATDISTDVLNHSIKGIYTEKNMKNINERHRNQYFTKINENSENVYQIDESIRKMVLFKRLNLSKPPFPLKGSMDVIFCRNVMIYFDDHVRTKLINEFHRLLKPGGYLFVGHSESLANINQNNMKLIKASVYRKEM